MCGRFVVSKVGSELIGTLEVDLIGDELPPPSYNVAPTDTAAIVLDSAKTSSRRLEPARWGLVPSWAKSPAGAARAINARSEEVERKPMFRDAFRRHRAVVPVTGYYEWQRVGAEKVPHFVRPAGDEPLFLAGLYSWWRDPARAGDDPARWLLSFTILTREATGEMAQLHERMPVFVDAPDAPRWLEPGTHDGVLAVALDGAERVAARLEHFAVGRAVGNVRNDGPELIEPAG